MRLGRSALWGVLGVALLVLAASSTVLVPVYGDDFRLSQHMYNYFDGSLWTAIATSAATGWQPNRFNPAGRFFAFVYHFLAYDVSATAGVSIHWFYRLGALLFLILLVASAAFCLRSAVQLMSTVDLNGAQAFAWLAAIVAVTMQIHPWSHDPLLTISEIGLTSGALTLAYVGLALRIGKHGPTTGRIVGVGLLAAFGTMFYETFVAAVAAVAVVWIWLGVRALRTGVGIGRIIAVVATGVILPFLIFVVGRLYVKTLDLPEYPGTALELGPGGLRPFGLLAAGTLPGTAWERALTESPTLQPSASAILVGLGIALLIGVLAYATWRTPVARLTPTRSWLVVLAVFVVLTTGTLAMHAFTQKYIAEITQLGDVYLSYSLLLTVSAMFVAAVVLVLPRRLPLALVALPLLAALAMVQQTANWSAAEAAHEDRAANATLLWMSAKEVPAAERCEALQTWLDSANWPDYYRTAVVAGINENYAMRFGEEFCESITD